MKTNLFYLVAVLMAIQLSSCSSSDDNGGGSSSEEGVTFKVNGTSVVADDFEAVLYSNSVAGGRYIDVFGIVGDAQVIEFHFPAKTGNFPAQQAFDMTSSWLTYLENGGSDFPGDYYHSTSGTINVTMCDTVADKIEATFHFVGNNTAADKDITDGNLKLSAITHQ